MADLGFESREFSYNPEKTFLVTMSGCVVLEEVSLDLAFWLCSLPMALVKKCGAPFRGVNAEKTEVWKPERAGSPGLEEMN